MISTYLYVIKILRGYLIAVCIVLNLYNIFCVCKRSLCEYVTVKAKYIHTLICKCNAAKWLVARDRIFVTKHLRSKLVENLFLLGKLISDVVN